MIWFAFWFILGISAGFGWGVIWHSRAIDRQRRAELSRRIVTTIVIWNQTGKPVHASRDAVDYVQPQWRN